MEEITVELLKSTFTESTMDKAVIVDDDTKEKVKLSLLNYKNKELLKEKGYLLHNVIKKIEEKENVIEIHV